MSFNNTISNIKNCLSKNNIEYKQLFLFGSRAENTHDLGSDYDVCILLDRELNFRNKIEISNYIYKELQQTNTLLPIDLILKNSSEFEEECSVENTFSWKILHYGIQL